MGIFTPFSYFEKNLIVPSGTVYITAFDPFSGSLNLAVPGTDFGVFSQTNYYSDISSEVRGAGSNVDLISTGSLLYASASVVDSGSIWDFAVSGGYDSSIFTEDATTIGVANNSEFGWSSNDWVAETWVKLDERMYVAGGPPFHKSIMRDTTNGNILSCDISFLSNNSPNYRMRTILNGTQFFTGTIVADLGNWYHYAWVRSNGNMYMYQNGVRYTPSPTTTSTTIPSIGTRVLGGSMNVNDGAKGVTQDIKVTIGTDKGYRFSTIPTPNSIVTEQQLSGIVGLGLQTYLDAGNATSYPGSGTTWFDLSGNGNNGTLVNSPSHTSGDSGYFQLNGSNQYVRLLKGLNQSGNTFMIIAKSTAGSKTHTTMMTTLLTGATTSSTPYRDLTWDTTTCGTYSYVTSPGVANIAASYNLNQWYSFAITEGNCLQNGFFDDTQTITDRTLDSGGTGENQQITVGTGYWGYSNMQVAAILIYDRKLSNEEIQQNYDIFNARY